MTQSSSDAHIIGLLRDGIDRAEPVGRLRLAAQIRQRRVRQRNFAAGSCALGIIVLLPAYLIQSNDDSGRSVPVAGAEAAQSDDATIPGIEILNGSSPAVRLTSAVAGCLESQTSPGTRVLFVIADQPKTKTRFYVQLPESEFGSTRDVAFPWDPRSADGAQLEDHAAFAASRGNEASGSQKSSSGTMEVLGSDCTLGSAISIKIDAAFGSEFDDGTSLNVKGSLETTIVDISDYR